MAAIQRKTGREATTKRKTANRRELIDTGTNKLFVRRNARGRRKVSSGQGDRGDRR